jgi:ABC-type amino acid transport substrate-binding protein
MVTFFILPAIIATFTPFTFGEVIKLSRDALITAFATNNLFVVLPLLVRDTNLLFEQRELNHRDIGPSIDVVTPVAFTFPHLGKLLTLIFIPFAAWFIGQDLSVPQYVSFIASGLLSFFGSTTVAIPFLLDEVRLPADLFELYVLSGVFVGRFGILLGAMSLMAFTILTTCAVAGLLTFKRRRLVVMCVGTTMLIGVVIVATRFWLQATIEGTYRKDEIIKSMQLLEDPAPSKVFLQTTPNPVPLEPGESRLHRIRQRGTIRVGYHPDAMPFAFFNARDELVGFDVEMAHRLASELGLEIEFVPITLATMSRQLETDHVDVIMSGVAGSVARYEAMLFTDSYLDVTPALAVRDHLRHEFRNLDRVRAKQGLRLGVARDPSFLGMARGFLPNAELVPMDSPRPYFEGKLPDIDAMALSAEMGSAWTLLYPDFAVVLYPERSRKWPLGYPVAGRDEALAGFLNDWIELKKKDGTIQRAYDHWILGRDAEAAQPRWSVIRNVLGWVE